MRKLLKIASVLPTNCQKMNNDAKLSIYNDVTKYMMEKDAKDMFFPVFIIVFPMLSLRSRQIGCHRWSVSPGCAPAAILACRQPLD